MQCQNLYKLSSKQTIQTICILIHMISFNFVLIIKKSDALHEHILHKIGVLFGLNSKAIYVNNITDLNNPPKCPILDTKINPIGLPSGLGSNACFVIQQNLGTGNYTAQLAFSFGYDKIAIRRKNKTDSWTEWKYFKAQ